MTIELKMPALSPTMEKGTLARWLVAEGDLVVPGDLLAEIETDKATMEFEAVDHGRIARLLIAPGTDDVAVGTLIALLVDEDTTTPSASMAGPAKQPVHGEATPIHALSTEIAASSAAPGDQANSHRGNDPYGDIEVTPLARAMAKATGVTLKDVVGRGPDGRIMFADLALDLPVRGLAAPRVVTGGHLPRPWDEILERPSSSAADEPCAMRYMMARPLMPAKEARRRLDLTVRCNVDALLQLRCRLDNEVPGSGVEVSAMLVKATAVALAAVPEANVRYFGEDLSRISHADIAIAISTAHGLALPVLRGVDALSLSGIAQRSKLLIEQAGSGTLPSPDQEGVAASIFDPGWFGIDGVSPLIDHQHAITLGVGAGARQPWNVDGEVALATVMTVTGSFDQTAFEPAVASRFMAAFRSALETPMTLLS